MAKYTVRKGMRYWAEVTLGFFERFASNALIASKLAEVGFAEIDVKGEGRRREVTALWPLDDVTAEIPSQISRIVERPAPREEPQQEA